MTPAIQKKESGETMGNKGYQWVIGILMAVIFAGAGAGIGATNKVEREEFDAHKAENIDSRKKVSLEVMAHADKAFYELKGEIKDLRASTATHGERLARIEADTIQMKATLDKMFQAIMEKNDHEKH